MRPQYSSLITVKRLFLGASAFRETTVPLGIFSALSFLGAQCSFSFSPRPFQGSLDDLFDNFSPASFLQQSHIVWTDGLPRLRIWRKWAVHQAALPRSPLFRAALPIFSCRHRSKGATFAFEYSTFHGVFAVDQEVWLPGLVRSHRSTGVAHFWRNMSSGGLTLALVAKTEPREPVRWHGLFFDRQHWAEFLPVHLHSFSREMSPRASGLLPSRPESGFGG